MNLESALSAAGGSGGCEAAARRGTKSVDDLLELEVDPLLIGAENICEDIRIPIDSARDCHVHHLPGPSAHPRTLGIL